MVVISRPDPDEYPPFYAGYIAAVVPSDAMKLLRDQMDSLKAAFAELSETAALHRYAPGKWSVKEVLGHITDAERVFAYRLLRISRGDATPLSGFDENAFVAAASFDQLALASLLADFMKVREASISLVLTLPNESATRTGIANGAPISVRALIFIMAGHVQHHLGILRDRYGVPTKVATGTAPTSGTIVH